MNLELRVNMLYVLFKLSVISACFITDTIKRLCYRQISTYFLLCHCVGEVSPKATVEDL